VVSQAGGQQGSRFGLGRLFQATRGALRASANRQVGAIGLDLASDGIRLVQLERSDGIVALRACDARSFDPSREELLLDPGLLRELLKEARGSGPFKGRRVVTALPSEQLKLMVLNYSVDGSSDEETRILELVGERIQEPVSDCVVDFLPIRTTAQESAERSALVAVARRVDVLAYLDLLRSAGLEVTSLEIGALAIRRVVGWIHRSRQSETVLVMHWGAERTELSVLWGRRLILHGDVALGTRQALETIGKGLNLDVDAASDLLATYGVSSASVEVQHEIAHTFESLLRPVLATLVEQARKATVYTAFQTRGANVDACWMVGEPARWRGVCDLVGDLLELPVRELDPCLGLAGGVDPRLSNPSPGAYAIAVGHALRGLSDE